jgi:GrpB-like predicted nucleotidyltransferase (UPF0157 family)
MLRRIEVVPYDSKWKDEFLKIKQMVTKCIGDLIIGIEHVGSTSVYGLASKPIIDFNIIIESYDIFPAVVKRLEAIGFEHEGDLGIKDREAFKRKFSDEFMPYHMYVCPKDSVEHKRAIMFRDYLRTHKEDMQAYGELKTQLAEKYRHDIDSYINGKHDFVEEVLEKAKIIVKITV